MLAEPGFVARRLAVLVESALGRLQVMRLLDARDAQCFTDPVEAREWLLRER
ncbi:hypothetical protein [Sphingomonas corticis]|uniref:Uncharacterized protein n=1 Tax=Sphingomonas corticis TaxID=2722791 RepID=A0ABX1CUE6_9SPHN|nr:hypothetical protein [Sphingomonas corticis]NJR80588.1 hypothetical protein [Sphingomonas corticis]